MNTSNIKSELRQRIRKIQEELVRLEFSPERDSEKHQSLIESLNKARNMLSKGLYN